MLPFLALLALPQDPAALIKRDSYGVPQIEAKSQGDAFRAAGYAVAQDRLWQLETSRRNARGRMAEVFGRQFAASDREVLLSTYTDEELVKQLDALSPLARQAYEEYAAGVNSYIATAKAKNALPKGYADAGFEPEPWTPIDSAAIAVRMAQLFGRGGAGEIRNLALVGYLKTQPVKDRFIDVIDDFAWQNDPASPTTVPPADDPLAKKPPRFPILSRQITQRHLEMLPEVNLFELLPGLRLASMEDSKIAAESTSGLFKTGSYAMVVAPQRSATKTPLLLSAPQMGFRTPSVVHEMSIKAPGIDVVGLDVPGIPGVIIGYTPSLAWALTSGVADTDDIFYAKTSGKTYQYGDQTREIVEIERALKIKGEPDEKVVQRRTLHGPIVVTSASTNTIFARRSSFWMRELAGFDSVFDLYTAKSPSDVRQLVRKIPVTFNLFFATTQGDIGYFYTGAIPMRAEGVDPRFPTPADPKFEWSGFIPPDQMPQVVNPKGGLLANWNNKPVSWWPNFDTPAWGRVFRASSLFESLQSPSLSVVDLELAAWSIARMDETVAHFLPHLLKGIDETKLNPLQRDALRYLRGHDSLSLAGSQSAAIYKATLDALREEIFLPTTGNFISPDLFRLAAQPSVIINALEGKTRYPYLGKRPVREVITAAFEKAVDRLGAARGQDPALWGEPADGIAVPGQPPIPYSNRGTYIQIVELRARPFGRSVLPPGVAETGPHSLDQVPLARAWLYKPMRPAIAE